MPTTEPMRQSYNHWTIETKYHTNQVASDHPLATWRHATCVVMHECHVREARTRELMPTTPMLSALRAFSSQEVEG